MVFRPNTNGPNRQSRLFQEVEGWLPTTFSFEDWKITLRINDSENPPKKGGVRRKISRIYSFHQFWLRSPMIRQETFWKRSTCCNCLSSGKSNSKCSALFSFGFLADNAASFNLTVTMQCIQTSNEKKHKYYHHLREIKTCDMQRIAVFGCCSGKMPLKRNWLFFDTVYVKKQKIRQKTKNQIDFLESSETQKNLQSPRVLVVNFVCLLN